MRFQTPTVLIVLLSVLTLTSAADTPPTSVEIKVTNPVECTRKTKKGDKLDMHYRGTIWGTGAEFDASYNRGQPFHFELGAGRVIKGWDEGLLDMCIGEKRTLTIPPEFGYGQRAMGSIPAGSTLVFETELMGIKGVKRDEL